MINKLGKKSLIIFFLTINLIFNFQLVKEIVTFNPKRPIINDGIMAELFLETGYENLKNGQSPFIINQSILYPFRINFSLNDPGTALLLLFSPIKILINDGAKAILFLAWINFLLNSTLMHLFLTNLKFNRQIAIIFSLIFSYTPFLAFRLFGGHYAYTAVYIYPLFFLLLQKLKKNKTNRKTLPALGLGLLMTLSLLTSFYYFLSLVLVIVFSLIFLIGFNRDQIKSLGTYINSILISLSAFLISSLPWLKSAYQKMASAQTPSSHILGSSITLSADLSSFLLPSRLNPIYNFLFKQIGFQRKTYETAYPGIIILFCYAFLILKRRGWLKKLKIKYYSFQAILFWLLTLGPFLKVFNHWSIDLRGVAILLPLPFLIIQQLPGLTGLRAPTRFLPMFIFFSCILGGYLFNGLLENLSDKKRKALSVFLIGVVFLDQFFITPYWGKQSLPYKIYDYIKNQENQGVVLEIPFTVRDGFQYQGFMHAISPIKGALIHKHPAIGGYLARVDSDIFGFYKRKKLINYLAEIIDKGNYNAYTGSPNEPEVYLFDGDLGSAKQELEDLNIKYILIKEGEKYSPMVKELLAKLGLVYKISDADYQLYVF